MALFRRKQHIESTPEQPAPPSLPDPPQPGPDGLRAVADHRDYLLHCIEALPAFGQHVLDTIGLTLCQDIVSDISLPRFDNSAMDGYAVRAVDVASASEDSPVSLPVVGNIAAGAVPQHSIAPGTAMKVMTGARIPDGGDAVVPYEATNRGDADVKITEPSELGKHIRRRGDDIVTGATVAYAGQRLTPRSIGLLAGIGVDKVLVRPQPRVVIVSTGSELVEPGQPLERETQIYDANSYLLTAAVRAAGAQVFRPSRVPDDADELRQMITDQLVRADLILTTGGVSQGDFDLVKQVLPELGGTDFCQVAMQPGKPQGFGLIGDDKTPTIMMPGNPVSAFVSFETFVRPVLRKLTGTTPLLRPTVRCTAEQSITSVAGKLQLARGLMSTDDAGMCRVRPAGGHGSHLLGGLAAANALMLLGPESDFVAAGDDVAVWPLGEGDA
jgi:molybdopterin molybdotransferase